MDTGHPKEYETSHPVVAWAKRFGSATLKFLFIALAAGVGTTGTIILLVSLLGSQWSELGTGFVQYDQEHESALDCNVVALDIHGVISTYREGEYAAELNGTGSTDTISGEVVSYLEEVKADGSIKAVLLDIDSTGGYPQAAREIVDALRSTEKPSVAWIRGNGDSAAYWVASAASAIVASRQSSVGSIGVSSSYVDNAKQNERLGITFNSISTGPFKDTGSADKLLTTAERDYLQKQNHIVLDDFIREVAEYRTLTEEKVRALADGSSLLGAQAKEVGLVDRLGTKSEALAALEEAIGEEPRLCWPQYQ